VAGLALASRRLLGSPVGTLRALIAGLLGFAVAEAFGRSLQPVRSGNAFAFFTVALGVPVIVAMTFIVVTEALVPTRTGPRPADIVRGARRAVARSRRYSQISRDRGAARAPPLPAGTAAAPT
jgi:ubiquinone biosynthesis protein